MSTATLAFITPPDAARWKRWLLYSALARIVIFVLFGAAIAALTLFVLKMTGLLGLYGHGLEAAAVDCLLRCIPTLGAYLLLLHGIEHRRLGEHEGRRFAPQVVKGMAIGVALISVVFATLWLAGSYHVSGTRPIGWLAALLSLGVGAGISEEIVFRGVLYRIVEEGLGTWAALLVSALAFGAIHLGNPHATTWSALAIAIEAGILFGLLYHVTRSLWLCMGLHAAWNVMEGPFYGASVSGLSAHGWLQSALTGPNWLSGGIFGPEASLVTVACCSALSVLLLVIALRRHSIVPPFWRRKATG
jgi:hypothetical protein